ncbi:helix-turn-helix transcriptional regulator [Brevibacterium yomogidense]|nr:helix-turn-helix domain-containing protein [Brevibacterium yomogidense]
MTRAEAADFLRVGEKWLANKAYAPGSPKFFKVGKHARYRRSDLEAWTRLQDVQK